MNYQTADAKLTGRNRESRKVGNNTYLRRSGEDIVLRLHDTDILTFHKTGSVTLNSGGWRTVTTKARLNEHLDGKWGISQENGQWFIERHEESGPEYWKRVAMFSDGVTLFPSGKVTGAEPLSEYQKKLQLRRRAQRYAAKYMQAFAEGKVPAPSGADCYICLAGMNEREHLLSHIEENYFVPSLLKNAFQAMPHSISMGWAIAAQWDENFRAQHHEAFAEGNFMRPELQKMLSRYILKQLGQSA